MYVILQVVLRDGGERYTETDLSRLIVEPWNGASALLFLGIVAFWAYKLRGQYRQHLFLSINLPILAIGGIGGTLYHAFRMSAVFLMMDWLPIMILCFAASVYFFIRVLDNWWLAALIVGLALLSQVLMFRYQLLPMDLAVNVNYTVMGALILVPTVLLLWKTGFRGAQWIGYALASFVVAVSCRVLDHAELLPMGTHFLWHVFGAAACTSMFQYVYELNRVPVSTPAPVI